MIMCTKLCMNLTKKAEKRSSSSISRDSKEIPVLEKDGKVYSTDFSKPNVLNEYFYLVFTQDDDSILPDMGNILYPDMPAVEVETAGISKLLRE